MLDKLIAMLPGVELKKDGVITVNGPGWSACS